MTTNPFTKIKFTRNSANDFHSVLNKRVAEYFEQKGVSKYADGRMVIKTIFMLALYFVPFILSLTVVESKAVFLLLWVIMGIGSAGIGLSVMHDANHGAYSSNKRVNEIMGYCLNVIGGCASYWKIQHNVLHHTYTNIQGFDEDISRVKILRFSPNAEKRKIHRYQHYYAWFLYSLMTLAWVTIKEFSQLFEFRDRGILKNKAEFNKMLVEVVLTKALYYGYILVLPMLILPFSPWFILLAFLITHLVAGFILSCVFQPAHVMPDCEYPMPDDEGNIENNWAVHQLLTTANYANKSRIFSWYAGGLNFQIEHHLFPHICHIHYKKIAPIVRKTAEEFNLPYHSEKTVLSALASHTRMLKMLAT
jgi:linoleoyl-CoA desaturase